MFIITRFLPAKNLFFFQDGDLNILEENSHCILHFFLLE